MDPDEGQSERRRDRARPSDRRDRLHPHDQGDVRAAAHRRPLRAHHDVHRRRPGHRGDHRADLGKGRAVPRNQEPRGHPAGLFSLYGVTVNQGKLKVGIAGLGRMGRHHAANLARHVPGAELVAACSPVADELGFARDALGVATLQRLRDRCSRTRGSTRSFSRRRRRCTPTRSSRRLKPASTCSPKSRWRSTCAIACACEAEAREPSAAQGDDRLRPPLRSALSRCHDKDRAGAIGRPFLVRSQSADQNDPDGFFVRFAPTSAASCST